MSDVCGCGSTSINSYSWDDAKTPYCLECTRKFWASANTEAQAAAQVQAAQRVTTSQACVTAETGEPVKSVTAPVGCRDFRKSGKGRPALALPCLNCKVPYSLHS